MYLYSMFFNSVILPESKTHISIIDGLATAASRLNYGK